MARRSRRGARVGSLTTNQRLRAPQHNQDPLSVLRSLPSRRAEITQLVENDLRNVARLIEIEDRRTPFRQKLATGYTSKASEVVQKIPITHRNPMGNMKVIQAFRTPESVMTCVRRQQRREVILATGNGGKGYKKPKWNDNSKIKCVRRKK